MALSHRQELRHSQSLVMTPQLQQAIKLLQLSNLELAAYIESELERNPLLERGDADGEDNRDSGEESGGTEAAAADAAQWSDSDSLPSADEALLDIDQATANRKADADTIVPWSLGNHPNIR